MNKEANQVHGNSSAFEPFTSKGKKGFAIIWSTVGFLACILTWISTEELGIITVRIGFVILTGTFWWFLPVSAIFVTRIAKELIREINSNIIEYQIDSKLFDLGIFSFRYKPFFLCVVISFIPLSLISIQLLGHFGYSLKNLEHIPIYISCTLSMLLFSVSIATGIQACRVASSIPFRCFYTKFLSPRNKALNLYSKYISVGTTITSCLWGIASAATYLTGISQHFPVMIVIFLTSLFPLLGAYWLVTYTRGIKQEIRTQDLLIANKIVQSAINKDSSNLDKYLTQLGLAVDLQSNVEASKFLQISDYKKGTFIVSAIPILLQIYQSFVSPLS